MAELLPIIIDMLKRPDTNKVLSTSSAEGRPHSIICGSLLVTDPSTIVVGQVYMYRTVANLEVNPHAEFLVWRGAQAYSIQAVVRRSYDHGPNMEKMEKLLGKMKMSPVAVWEFDVVSAHDEGVTEKAGSKVL